MFWKKKKPVGSPRELDRTLARIIGKEWSKITIGDCNHWVKYMAVMHQHGDNEDVFDVRVYDQGRADQKKIKVVDYSTLEHYGDLIIFEGWFDRKNKKGDMHFKKAA
jgi:hypothetical protein